MWDEVLGHQQNKEFLEKLLKTRQPPACPFVLWYGRHWQKMLALHFAKTFLCKSAAKKALRYLRELPIDGY